ncbi:O-antigen ligase family protein [Halovulum sp. GXIMD14793]
MPQIRIGSPVFLPVLLASIPTVGAISWLALGSLDGPRNQSVINLFPAFQMLTIFVAILFGLTRANFVKAPPAPILLGLIGAAGVILLGLALNASHPMDGAIELLLRLIFVVLAISVAFLCSRFDRRLWDAFGKAVFFLPLVHLPILVLLYLLYIDEPSMNWLGGPVGYEHVRLWAIFLATALAMGFGMSRGPVLWLGAVLLWAMLFWSGSRGSLVGIVAAYALSLALFWPQMRASLLPFLATAAVGAGLSLIPKLPMFSYGLITSFNRTVEATSADAFAGGRMRAWSAALDYFREHPVIGHGFDHYRYLTKGTEVEWLHPHNFPLQLLVNLGILGAICVAGVLLYYWLRGTSHTRADRDATRIGAFTALNTLLAISLVDGVLYHPEPMTMVAVLFGMVFATPRVMDSPPA